LQPLETADDAAIQLLKMSFTMERESDTGIMGTLESGSVDEKIRALKVLKQLACGTLNDGQVPPEIQSEHAISIQGFASASTL
jgi:hypothetical protein